MEKKEFKTTIEAPKEKVWRVLWNNETYPLWTAAFCEGSRAETDWEKGSKVRFLGGDNEGMVSVIAQKVPNESMSFEHRGIVKDGAEDYTSTLAKEWAGSIEDYRLVTLDGKTELTVTMDIAESHRDYFLTTWPKALEKVKELAETR